MLLELKQSVTYGPVNSRRLGRSLGINVLGRAAKLCTFDCLYCQYGWTDPLAVERLDPAAFPSVEEVVQGVAAAIERLPDPPAFLTFSGNGEPTLHPEFPALVDGVIALRDRLAPVARTAILSNSSRAGDPRVRAGLARLDARIMKLDAGNQATFELFNRPLGGLTIAEILAGLRALGRVTLQSLFADGPAGNLGAADIAAWLDAAASVAPLEVQIYTLARGYPSRDIGPASPEKLEAIAGLLRLRGVTATVY